MAMELEGMASEIQPVRSELTTMELEAAELASRNLPNAIVNVVFGTACFVTWGVIQQLKDIFG